MAVLALALVLTGGCAGRPPAPRVVEDLSGQAVDIFHPADPGLVVVIFVRTDCPISNRYAPLIERMARRFQAEGIRFYLAYADPEETAGAIQKHLIEYSLSVPALRDAAHVLVRKASARVTPEAAVFLPTGDLLYHGRIDNRYLDFGKDRLEATEHDLEDVLVQARAGRRGPFPSKPAIGCSIPGGR